MQEQKGAMQEQKGAMKAVSALKAESALKAHVVDFAILQNYEHISLSAMHTCFKKSPTSDDSANILEILYTS